jgi:nicotinamidase-related amidase
MNFKKVTYVMSALLALVLFMPFQGRAQLFPHEGGPTQMKTANGVAVYKNLREIVEPNHSCLIVWDVQNGLVDRIFNKEEFIATLKSFIEKLRDKMPVVYTLVTPLPKGFVSSWNYYSMMKRFNVDDINKLPPFMAIGSKEREIPEIVKPQPTDIVLQKSTASIFIGTNFEYMMRNRGVTTLIFTGIATEFGVESSARDASNRGFYPVVVSDCVSSSDKEAHERSLKNMAKLLIVQKSVDILQNVD